MTARIITTIGPNSSKPEILCKLRDSSLVDTFRLNLSHLNFESLSKQVDHFKQHKIRPALDTQGAQLRVSHEYGNDLKVNSGDIICLDSDKSVVRNEKRLIPNHPEVLKQLEVGDELKIDFNGAVCRVMRVEEKNVLLETINGGNILQNRAVDVTGKKLDLSPLTQFDIEALKMTEQWGVEEVFLSFANHPSDVKYCRSLLPSGTKIISKIESINGITNLREIATSSDAILIDRGDLSREVGIGRLPLLVQSIISVSKECDTPVYVATNILDTMIDSPLPSRAEVSDLYSLLDMGVDGIVLAAEVAIGKHPIESVQLVNFIRKLHSYEADGFAVLPDLITNLKQNISEPLRSWL